VIENGARYGVSRFDIGRTFFRERETDLPPDRSATDVGAADRCAIDHA
jgi:hypothetical protein